MDGFFGIGLAELFMIAVVALVVLGPERLPGALREVAKFIRTVRNMTNELTSQFGDEFKVLEDLNPQKILRELAEDPDEKAKAATKTAAKSTAKPVTTKPATPKPATRPATTKPATTSTATSKPATPKPAVTTPKVAGASATSKPAPVATPATESAVAVAEKGVEAAVVDAAVAVEDAPAAIQAELATDIVAAPVAESLVDTPMADAPVADAEGLPGVKVFDSPNASVEVEETEVAAMEKSPVAIEEEPSILPPTRREPAFVEPTAQSEGVVEIPIIESLARDVSVTSETTPADAATDVVTDAVPETVANPVSFAAAMPDAAVSDTPSDTLSDTPDVTALDVTTFEVASSESVEPAAEVNEADKAAIDVAATPQPPQVKAKRANGNHATIVESHFSDNPVNGDHGSGTRVNGNSTESET